MSASTPVVLLHSSGASSRQWQALAGMLRPRHEVHAVDLYGHGSREAWPGPAPMSLADEAAAQHFVDFWSGTGSWAALAAERQQGAAARMPAVRQQFGAQHETFDPMGHMGPVTHAALFNHRVAEFLQGLGEPRDRTSFSPRPTLLRTAP